MSAASGWILNPEKKQMGRISRSALLDGVQLHGIRDLQNRWSMAIWPGKPSTRTYQVFANKWSAPELSNESRLPGWASSYRGLQMDSTEIREKKQEGGREGGMRASEKWGRSMLDHTLRHTVTCFSRSHQRDVSWRPHFAVTNLSSSGGRFA